MASNAYYEWIDDGSPYKDCEPIKDEAAIWRSYGYTVWTKGDSSHMKADPPQDHTPFSETGWPDESAYPIGHAFDVPNESGRMYPLWQIAEQMIRDKDANVPGTEWIKYLNYTDKNGDCWHVSWQPKKSKTHSDDKGHLHVSARSDMDKVNVTYDPIARLKEADMSAAELLDEDIVPNRPWRGDHPDNAPNTGATPNPTVRWEYAVTNTWDEAHYAKIAAEQARDKATEALAVANQVLSILTSPTEPLPGDVEGKVDQILGILANLTLRAVDVSPPSA